MTVTFLGHTHLTFGSVACVVLWYVNLVFSSHTISLFGTVAYIT